MEFRLTYEGRLLAAGNNNKRSGHKHEIRKRLHKQLKRLWRVAPNLVERSKGSGDGFIYGHEVWHDELAKLFARGDYNFVPLVTRSLSLVVEIDILLLRPDVPGDFVKSGDIDGRLKTLLDALQIPQSTDHLGPASGPYDDEKPFYCLLEDDSLITRLTVETDTLLDPALAETDRNNVQATIAVKLRPYSVGIGNADFG